MKVELKEVENKGFEAFKIELTIETLEELKDLHARLFLTKENVDSMNEGYLPDSYNAIGSDTHSKTRILLRSRE